MGARDMMIEDGLPAAFLVSQEERKAAWRGRKLTTIRPAPPKRSEEDPATRKLRKELEAAAEKKKAERFARLKELKAETRKAAMPAAIKGDTAMTTKAKKTAKKTTAKKATKAKAKAAAPLLKTATVKKGTGKNDIVAKLLIREQGCTLADILKATGWKAVSVPRQATNSGLKLRQEKKQGEKTRYFGTAAQV